MLTNILTTHNQQELEAFLDVGVEGRHVYGALPFFKDRLVAMEHLPEEEYYFARYENPFKVGKSNQEKQEALVYFECKFGMRLSHLAEKILSNYPKTSGIGKIYSLFGLSGCGKTSILSYLQSENALSHGVYIDNDAARYGLFAKLVLDAESSIGTSLEEIRLHQLHNFVSKPFYLLLDFLAQELRSRGYSVVRASTNPLLYADALFYIEHPLGIDPQNVDISNDLSLVTRQLRDFTDLRANERDNYPWHDAQLVLRFEEMQPISSGLSERVHQSILVALAKFFHESTLSTKVHRIANPYLDTIQERKTVVLSQLLPSL